MNIYKKILRYIKPYLWSLIPGIFCLIIVGMLDVIFAWLFKFLIDDVLNKSNVELLNWLAIGSVLLYTVKGLFNYSQIFLLTSIGEKVVVDIRNDIYKHLQNLSLSFYTRKSTGDLISRITNDVNIIQNSITMGLSNLILQPVKIIGAVGFMFYINWKLTLVSFTVLPLVAYAVSYFGDKMRRVSTRIQDRLGVVTSIIQETLSGIRIVKAFNMENEEIKRFVNANDKTLSANLRGVQIKASLLPVLEIIVACGVAVFLWYGGHQVVNGNLTTGELVTFLTLLASLWSPINILSDNYHLLQKAIGSSERIFELMAVDEKVKEIENAKDMPKIEGKVEFKEVYFSYKEEEEILKNINLIVEPGDMIALVGQSGAGKTTLANLIPRFYDLDGGQILIDGIDIREVTLESLRSQIGIVPQDTVLFKGTIADNIAYGTADKNLQKIKEAARQANAHGFISEFKNGYETEVGERGVSLSGGQKQRIAIARAILTDPRILILDEATSSLDTKSENLVQEALERLMKDRTTFIIAHRLSTIIAADTIIVLDNGSIVEKGNHQELLDKKGYYYSLYQRQINHTEKKVYEL